MEMWKALVLKLNPAADEATVNATLAGTQVADAPPLEKVVSALNRRLSEACSKLSFTLTIACDIFVRVAMAKNDYNALFDMITVSCVCV